MDAKQFAQDRQYRKVCKYNEEYAQPILDNLYRMLNIHTERVYDVGRQTKGADIIFHSGTESMALDEKVRSSRFKLYVARDGSREERLKESRDTYDMELSCRNRSGEIVNGWFHPSERNKAINSGYMIAWTNYEKEEREGPDQGKFRKISQMEICIVPDDKVREVVLKACAGKSIEEMVEELYGKIDRMGARDQRRVFDYYPLANRGVKFIYNGDKNGQSLNCSIPKKMLREMSFVNYAFNFSGELGQERVTEFKNLKDERDGTFRPVADLRKDIKEHPVGFPRPHYLSLEDKKERLIGAMGNAGKAFSMFVPHQYIRSHSLDFLRYADTAEEALEKMVSHCVEETGMVNSKYYPIVMNTTKEAADELSTKTKRHNLMDAVLVDHDRLSELYTIKALEEWNYPPEKILKATSAILPSNILGLEERIQRCANYIDRDMRNERGVQKGFDPNRGRIKEPDKQKPVERQSESLDSRD